MIEVRIKAGRGSAARTSESHCPCSNNLLQLAPHRTIEMAHLNLWQEEG